MFQRLASMKNKTGKISRFLSIFPILGISLSGSSQEQKPDTLSKIGLQEVVVSALRLPFKENTVPYSISLMNARTNTQGLSLAEDLAGLPGLEVNDRYNYAVGDRIINRGFGARTQFGVRGIRIVQDDMPVTFADGQSNLEMIDLQNLSYVEHLRGPGSSLYGNASGGILILHSNPLSNDRFLSSVSSTIGSNGLFRWNGVLQGRIGKTEISGNYTNFHYSGFRDHASAGYQRAIVKLVTNLTASDNLQVHAGYVNFNALNPGSLTKLESDQDPGKANPSSISNAAGQDGNQAELAATWKHQTDSNSLFKLTVYGIHRSIVNPIIGKIVVLPQYSGGMVASYNSWITLGEKTLNWSAGTEIAARFNFRKNYLNNSGQESNLTIDQDEQVITSGLFIQALYPLTYRLKVDACLRYDVSYFGVRNNLLSSLNTDSSHRYMTALNPSFGVIYTLNERLNCFANITSSFETPTSTELVNRPDGAGGFNPDLNPSRAIEYEAGLRGYINPLLSYDLAIYMIQTRDELIPYQVPSSPGQDYFRNAGSTIRRGGEMTFRLLPFSFLDLNTSLTYIQALYKNFIVKTIDYSGNIIPGISQFHEVTELKFHPSGGFYCSILMENHGKMYVDDANSSTASPHTIFDLGLGHEGLIFGKNYLKRAIISGGISNLFNTHYITAVTVNAAAARYYEPGPGRTYYLNVRFDFGRH
jgi:iron complex outermembrane receptor protein